MSHVGGSADAPRTAAGDGGPHDAPEVVSSFGPGRTLPALTTSGAG